MTEKKPTRRPTAKAAAPSVEAPKDDQPTAPAESPKGGRKKTAVLTPCLCGCDKEVGGKFAPGHDARFASALVTAVEFGLLSREDAVAAAKGVSDAFEAKVTKTIDGRAEKAAEARAAVEQAVKAAQAASK